MFFFAISFQNGSRLYLQGRVQAEEENGTFSHKQEAISNLIPFKI